MTLTNWANLFTWAALGVAVLSAIVTVLSWRRMKRTITYLKALWAAEATPVPPVTVTLKTGDTIDLVPVDPHQAWVWLLPIPFEPDQVEHIDLPLLPPYTSVIPVPPDGRP